MGSPFCNCRLPPRLARCCWNWRLRRDSRSGVKGWGGGSVGSDNLFPLVVPLAVAAHGGGLWALVQLVQSRCGLCGLPLGQTIPRQAALPPEKPLLLSL